MCLDLVWNTKMIQNEALNIILDVLIILGLSGMAWGCLYIIKWIIANLW